jgi:leucine dehydrogenase
MPSNTSAPPPFGATAVAPEDYLSTLCDVLSPCAIGGVVNERSIPTLRTQVIAGGANNILGQELSDAERLVEAGIAMAPDYVINAGGLIAMYAEWTGGTLDRAMADTENIYETTLAIFERAAREKSTTMAASRALAEERIRAVNSIRSHYSPPSQLHDGRHVR